MSRLALLCVLPILLVFASVLLAAEARIRVDPLPKNALARLGTLRFWHGSWIQCLAYSPDGKIIASGGTDRKIVLWDAQTGRKIRELVGHSSPVTCLAFSPDGKLLVSACHQPIRCNNITWMEDLCLWNVATGKLAFRLMVSEEITRAVAFSPDGKTIASGHDTSGVRLWDAQTGKITRVLAHAKPSPLVFGLAFAPDGKMLAVVEGEGKMRFWESQTGKMLQREVKSSAGLGSLTMRSIPSASKRRASWSVWKATRKRPWRKR